jgi:hypothetical protein
VDVRRQTSDDTLALLHHEQCFSSLAQLPNLIFSSTSVLIEVFPAPSLEVLHLDY